MKPILLSRTRDDAVEPSVATEGDVGMDMTLIGVRAWEGEVTVYRTGWTAQPPEGYHLELHARSSLHKKGYMLANSVGIIDPGYRGELLVALYKFDKSKPDLVTPCRAVQLVQRRTISPRFHVVDHLTTTVRGSGGFGSSGG